MPKLTVIYRLCGIASSNPSPVYQDNKYKLNELCLKTFITAFSDIKPKVIFLLDKCGVEYYDLLKIVPFEHEVKSTFFGINGTMLESYRIASELDGYVLFQECDYLYRGVIGQRYLDALERLDIVSPYDHLNFYIDHVLHSKQVKLELINGKHYRTTERNTMTWACHTDVVKENKDILDKYGYLDADVWYELKSRGYQLWVPITSFATHMVKDYLAPGVAWEAIWQDLA
jgi:hypothetical protein